MEPWNRHTNEECEMEDVHGLALDLLDRINGELRLNPSMNGLFARL